MPLGEIGSGLDWSNGAQFDLTPDVLEVILVPATDRPTRPLTRTQVVLLNGNPKSWKSVYFALDGGEPCELQTGELARRTLATGEQTLEVYHHDLFKIEREVRLDAGYT